MDSRRFKVGDFTVTGNELIVTDPCYDDGTDPSIRGIVSNVKNGNWSSYVHQGSISGWGSRNSELSAFHSSSSPEEGDDAVWLKVDHFEVGVDSGQAGMYDARRFPSDPGDYSEENSFYRKICDTTCAPLWAGTIEDVGVTSSSGFGDGEYECYILENENDEVVGVKIIFIEEDELETEETWDQSELLN